MSDCAPAKEEGECEATKLLRRCGVDRRALCTGLRAALGGEEASHRFRPGEPESRTGTETRQLDLCSRDLTRMAAEGKLDPLIGREVELERVIQILSRRTKHNPVLIGEPGVGKTAVAEGLALAISEGSVPSHLQHKRVCALDLSAIILMACMSRNRRLFGKAFIGLEFRETKVPVKKGKILTPRSAKGNYIDTYSSVIDFILTAVPLIFPVLMRILDHL